MQLTKLTQNSAYNDLRNFDILRILAADFAWCGALTEGAKRLGRVQSLSGCRIRQSEVIVIHRDGRRCLSITERVERRFETLERIPLLLLGLRVQERLQIAANCAENVTNILLRLLLLEATDAQVAERILLLLLMVSVREAHSDAENSVFC